MFIFLLVYTIGSLLLPMQELSHNFFFKLVIGVLGVIFFNSMYYTSFKTVNILYLPILFCLFFKRGKWNFNSVVFQEELKCFSISLIILFITILIQFYRLDYFNDEITYLSKGDFSYYISVAEYLFVTGIENVSPWYELNELSETGKVGPYHYGDLWLLGSFLQVSNLLPHQTFAYVFLPICITISFMGLYTFFLAVVDKKEKWYYLILCFFMVFSIGGIPFFREAFGLHNSPLTAPKVFLFFILILLAFIFLLKNRIKASCITISIIPILHILYAPTVFTALFLWSLYNFQKTKRKDYIYGMIYPSLIAIGIISFYFLFGGVSSFFNGTSKIVLNDYFKNIIVTTVRNIIARSVVFYPILIVMLFLVWKIRDDLNENIKGIFRFVSILMISTIFFRGLLNYNAESTQVYNVVFNPLFTVLYIFTFGLLLKYGKTSIKKIAFILIIFQATSSFYIILNKFQQRFKCINNEQLYEIQDALKNRNPLGGFIKSPIIEDDHFRVSTYLFLFGTELKMVGKNYWINSLSVPESLEDFEFPERITDVSSSPFYKFIQEKKEKGEYVNYELTQVDFIKKYNVEYILLEEGAVIPEGIKKLSSKQIEDKETGIRMILF